MDILITDDQAQIVASVVDVLADRFPLERLRPGGREDGGRSCWTTMAELGWFGLGLDEASGGVGFTLAEETLLFRELGRHLVSPNVLAAVLAARIAAHAGQGDLCADIVSGRVRPALGIARGQFPLGERITGMFYILDGDDSPLVVLWDETRALLVPRERFTDVQPVGALDRAVSLESARLDNASSLAVAPESGDPIGLRATVLVAAMQVGNAEATRDMAVGYAKVRQQFGQPIGAFQAIKHRCVDMAVSSEAAWCQTVMASITARDRFADALPQAAAAKLLATRAAQNNGAANIQVHGAMGFSAECDAHHFLKRAHLLEHVGGSLRHQQHVLVGAMQPAAYSQ